MQNMRPSSSRFGEHSCSSGVLDRGLLILSLFNIKRSQMHLREISEISGLDKATTLRAL
ncbi:helix-turn-helix domain-containing protein [Agrobacterium burrii]|uniref:Helix-turn-helix domain-containing protein n=1 Tax=Agrobacterium burrii TaxID=2815339 RepID=A0ABS3EIX7_9HYPH|nr:helix-turn-helix domain-containing protein [Agrobacterium burrii]MBO0131942.1 helix-turn-helix domain-containing protein [Agrobacterium burrii]